MTDAVDDSFPVEKGQDTGPQVLKNATSRGCVFTFFLVFAVFWNVVVSLFLSSTIGTWRQQGNAPIGQLLFMVPFLLVGIGVAVMVVYLFLGLFNPLPKLVCSNQNIYPGSEIEFSWLFNGSSSRISQLRLIFEGTESVTYRQGTSTRTDSHTFFRKCLIDVTSPEEIATGAVLFSVPPNLMHSLNLTSNKIIYSVRIEGVIRFWPDIAERFEFNILPPPLPDSMAGLTE